jgi:hypothetical protein
VDAAFVVQAKWNEAGQQREDQRKDNGAVRGDDEADQTGPLLGTSVNKRRVRS